MTTLLMSSRHTVDDQALWRAAIQLGWSTVRARGITVPEIKDDEIVIYVEALYGPTIAKLLGRDLLEPPEDWLVSLPESITKRKLRFLTVSEARELATPLFIKPPNDKSFEAKIYDSGKSLPPDLLDDANVIVSEPVSWESEFRCFCLDGKVLTVSPYLRSGELAVETDYGMTHLECDEAQQTAEEALELSKDSLPRAIVIDVGKIADKGWAVVEANGAWGSGVYGCDPNIVLEVIRHATV